MNWIQVLGLAAGTITSITFFPQVLKIWRSKSSKDLSLVMLLLLLLGTSLWLAYGIAISDVAIIFTNSMVLAMGFILLIFKFKYR